MHAPTLQSTACQQSHHVATALADLNYSVAPLMHGTHSWPNDQPITRQCVAPHLQLQLRVKLRPSAMIDQQLETTHTCYSYAKALIALISRCTPTPPARDDVTLGLTCCQDVHKHTSFENSLSPSGWSDGIQPAATRAACHLRSPTPTSTSEDNRSTPPCQLIPCHRETRRACARTCSRRCYSHPFCQP